MNVGCVIFFFFCLSELNIKLQLALIKEKALSKISEFKVSGMRNYDKFNTNLYTNQAGY